MFCQEEREVIYDVIYKRRDVRTFLPDPVSPEVIQRVLQAAHHAPSVGFMQPWNFIMVSSDEIKERLAWAQKRKEKHWPSTMRMNVKRNF